MSGVFFAVLGVATHYLNIFIVKREVNGLVLTVVGISERSDAPLHLPKCYGAVSVGVVLVTSDSFPSFCTPNLATLSNLCKCVPLRIEEKYTHINRCLEH